MKKKYRVEYLVSYGSGAYREYFIIIEAESFYRAFEKYRTMMARCQTRDSKVEMLKFELIKEEQK